MTRPRLILHIGTHKTGTSALQAALDGARERLLERGVLYPDTRRHPWPELPKHCSVYHAAASSDPALQARERELLLTEFDASRAPVMLISEEGLSEPDERIPAFFAPFADRFDIEVICFLRRQDLFVEALFNQFVREDARREARPLLMFTRAPATRARLDHHATLSRWTAIGAQVKAMDFDGEPVRRAGLMHAFEALLADLPLDLPERRANSSPDMRLALLLNRMNRQRMAYELPSLLQASRSLTQHGLSPLRHLLGRDERTRLLAECASSNRALASRFGIEFGADLPAAEPALAMEDVEVNYLLQLAAELSRHRTGSGAREPGAGRQVESSSS